MNVLLSIKPKFATKILNGEKIYEFRKSKFNPKKKVNKVYIYSSGPEKKIVGSFRIDEVFNDTPSNLWKKFNEFGGIEKQDFFKYYEQKEIGYAFKIKDLEVFEIPIDPREIFENFKSPQNYYYINDEDMSKIKSDSKNLKISDYTKNSISNDNLITRLLSESEIDQLDRLLIPYLSKKYPNFESWLQKAKSDKIKHRAELLYASFAWNVYNGSIRTLPYEPPAISASAIPTTP